MIKIKDNKIFDLIKLENKRQQEELQMIPSENYTSKAVRQAVGSVLIHKYSEGYPGNRHYEGNEFIDEIENLCKKRALKLFKLKKNWDVNVQELDYYQLIRVENIFQNIFSWEQQEIHNV